MINLKFKKTEPSALEDEIARVFDKLKDLKPTDTEYATVVDQLTKLYKLKETDSKSKLSKDTMATAATNLAGILLILNFEHAHALGSKALSHVFKIR